MPNGNDKDNNQNWVCIISVVVVSISILIWLCKHMKKSKIHSKTDLPAKSKKSKPKKKEKTSDDEDISIPLIKQTEQPKFRIIKRKARKEVSKGKEYAKLDTTAQIPDGYQSIGGGLQLALLGDHNGGYTTRNGGAHWVEAQGTDTLNIEGQPRQGDWNNPSTDLQVRSTTENLEKCITMLQELNNKITHKPLPYTRFTEILKKLKEKSVSIPDVVGQIKQLIVDLREAHKTNLERILRKQQRALAQKSQKGKPQFHPTDLSHDKTFEPNKIYLIETPFSQVFMVFTRGGRWMFHNHESAYYFSRGRTNPRNRPFGLPISYDKIATTLDVLDPDLKNQIYQIFKQYVLDGVMPDCTDVTKVKDHWIQPRIYGQFSEEVATYAGCLAAAWLLSESGPDRIRVRGVMERALLFPDFNEYGSFDKLIKSLPQAQKRGVKATNNAINGYIPLNETEEEKIKREVAIGAIEQIPPDNLSDSSDEEEPDDFKKQLNEIEETIALLNKKTGEE